MRYRLRTLLILLAVGPPMLAGAWIAVSEWRGHQQYIRAKHAEHDRKLNTIQSTGGGVVGIPAQAPTAP
jgi:hypothetical protein